MQLFDYGEALRYLGCKDESLADEQLINQVKNAEELLCGLVPRCAYTEAAISLQMDSVHVFNHLIASKALASHLQGCEKAVLFAATLGAEADRILRRYSLCDISFCTVLQAAMAAMLEQYCDAEQKKIAKLYEQKGLFIRPRFSPGYGDYSVLEHAFILDMTGAGKKLGLGLTDSSMLTPTKSITAVIGLSNENRPCFANKCQTCPNLICAYRKA